MPIIIYKYIVIILTSIKAHMCSMCFSYTSELFCIGYIDAISIWCNKTAILIINSRGRHYRLLLHSQLAFGFKFEDHRYPVEAIITGYDQNNIVHIYYRHVISLRFSSRAFSSQHFATDRFMFLNQETMFVVLQNTYTEFCTYYILRCE